MDSIECLRRMNFFQDYSHLSSEEIFDKILNGEIDYGTQWFTEEWSEEEWREKREEGGTHGQILKKLLEEDEEQWMKDSVSEIDFWSIPFDVKRVFVEDSEALIRKGMCEILLSKLARVSRGVFNPRYIKDEMFKWDRKPPPALKAASRGELWFSSGWIFRISFEFRGKENLVEFYSAGKYLYMNPLIERINELIKDTGYQYYALHDEDIILVVLREDEVKKLKGERGWKLYLPRVKAHS
ncbi:MAG: hypothetical protein FGF48_09310 [Candidatus Brockarchaeota archaeon]|nr:hypothetical protein [Candidatus Brockarchaeota archaeon]